MGKVLIGNVKGPKGETGVRGGKWIHGNAVTGTNTEETSFPDSNIAYAIVGDAYFNTETCNTYACTKAGNPTDAKWVYTGNIKGGKGDTGDTQTIQNAVLDFNEALTRENIKSTDTVETIFGKIKKYFTDLGSAAFMNVVNGVTQSQAGQAVLDAAVGKYLEEKKFDISKIIANRNITEPGFVMDGKTVADALTELNGNMDSTLILKAYHRQNGEYTFDFNNTSIAPGMHRLDSAEHILNSPGDDVPYGNVLVIKYPSMDTLSMFVFPYSISKIYYRTGTTETFTNNEWRTIMLNSDLGYIEREIDTVENTCVLISDKPSFSAIPVVVAHWSSNEVVENVFSDAGNWYIRSNISQKVRIRFYKYPV